MAVCQLVVTCVFSVVCALTDPTGVTVPAVFGSMGTVVVVANLFGLVLAVLYSVGLSRADPDVEYRSSRPVGWWDAALGAIIVLLMIPGLWGDRSSASVVRDVPVRVDDARVALGASHSGLASRDRILLRRSARRASDRGSRRVVELGGRRPVRSCEPGVGRGVDGARSAGHGPAPTWHRAAGVTDPFAQRLDDVQARLRVGGVAH